MTLEQFAFFNSITMVGYLIGGLMSGWVSDGFGRKKAVIVCGSIFTIACLVAATSPNADFLTACRFFMGIVLCRIDCKLRYFVRFCNEPHHPAFGWLARSIRILRHPWCGLRNSCLDLHG